LRPRTNLIGAVTRVRNNLSYATHKFFQEQGFLYIHTPIITASDCEGAGEMFQVTTLMPEANEPISKMELLFKEGQEEEEKKAAEDLAASKGKGGKKDKKAKKEKKAKKGEEVEGQEEELKTEEPPIVVPEVIMIPF
jgi:asparaginyl-tRNA synthetase